MAGRGRQERRDAAALLRGDERRRSSTSSRGRVASESVGFRCCGCCCQRRLCLCKGELFCAEDVELFLYVFLELLSVLQQGGQDGAEGVQGLHQGQQALSLTLTQRRVGSQRNLQLGEVHDSMRR